MRRLFGSRSLTRRTLWQVAVGISIVVALASVLSYWHVRSSLESQALEQLEQYVEQRRARESNVFVLASEHLAIFADAYRERLQDPPAAEVAFRFGVLFERRADGTTRLKESAFAEHGITGFIGKYVAIDDDLRQRLLIAFDLLARYGPAWRARFANLYVVTPENAILMYWPDRPWALHAGDWEINGKLALLSPADGEVVVVDPGASQELGRRVWSDLYFDYGANDWLVSALEPVNAAERHVLSVGHDVLLHELIDRTLTSDLEGTYNVIFDHSGRLIAHPRFMEAIQARSGALTIQETGDAHLQRILDQARERPDHRVVVENAPDDEFLAITQLTGPGWHLVTVLPQALVAGRALETARLVLLLGVVALALEIAILYLVLKKQVATPLRRLIHATRNVAAGRFNTRLEVPRDDEIGELAHAFNGMTEEINQREAALSERSTKLAEVNEQLARELEERRRAEAEIARQREALHQSEKLNALGSLLAGVAHELNNPLSVVVGRASILEEEFRDTPRGRSIAKMRAAAERCARIVKTFLAMARQDAPLRERVCVADVVGGTLDVVGYGLRRDGIDVSVDLTPDLPAVSADPNQLAQVLTNLLVNAQHALAEQPPPRRIRVSARLEAATEQLVVEVADNGPGIPDALAPRIFEPFFTTKPQGQGTGLGLSVCRGLIEAHGGTIDVRSPEDGGSVFEIRLPVGEAAPGPPERAEADRAHHRGRQILVVEDEPEIARMLAEILELLGHRVEVAQSGQSALERLSEMSFDLVLSDLRMPDVDGRDLFHELKRNDPAHADRVIFVTGDSLSESAARFLAETVRPVIEKPFTPDEVRRIVSQELERA